MSFRDEIEAFFKRYIDAFARSDADTLSELWEEVGLFPTPNGNFAMDRAAFREHCVKLMDFYRRQGIARPEGQLLSTDEIYPGVAEARMAYRMLGSNGEIIASWEHFYILRRRDMWRVTLTIADAEMAEWTARGAQF